MSQRPKTGFTLLEVLVSLLLVMLVMFLLVRAMDVMSTAVAGGQRQLDLHRQLETARRIMEDDFRAMLHGSGGQVFLREDAEDQPVVAFARYREGRSGETEREWVQYWIEPHPDPEQGRLRQLVRYSDGVELSDYIDPLLVDVSRLDREILLDDLIGIDLVLQTADEALRTQFAIGDPIEAVDIRLAVTTFPYPILNDVSADYLERVDQENGAWMEFRIRPESSW